MNPITVTVNDNACGAWTVRVGTELELVGPGHNHLHVLVRRPGERRTFGFPVRWLDGLKPDAQATQDDLQLPLVPEAT